MTWQMKQLNKAKARMTFVDHFTYITDIYKIPIQHKNMYTCMVIKSLVSLNVNILQTCICIHAIKEKKNLGIIGIILMIRKSNKNNGLVVGKWWKESVIGRILSILIRLRP